MSPVISLQKQPKHVIRWEQLNKWQWLNYIWLNILSFHHLTFTIYFITWVSFFSIPHDAWHITDTHWIFVERVKEWTLYWLRRFDFFILLAYHIRLFPHLKPFSGFPLKQVCPSCLLLMSVISANRVKMNNSDPDQHHKCNTRNNRFYERDMASW